MFAMDNYEVFYHHEILNPLAMQVNAACCASFPFFRVDLPGRERESQYLGVAEEDEGRAREAEASVL